MSLESATKQYAAALPHTLPNCVTCDDVIDERADTPVTSTHPTASQASAS